MSRAGRMKRWAETPWPEIEARRGEIIAVLAAGSVEQHGPHLPLGTDVCIPNGIADLMISKAEESDADFASRFYLLPPLFYSYAKESDFWAGTLNLDGGTLTTVVRDVMKNLFRQGVKDVMIINGHMESLSFVFEGVELALERYRGARVVNVNWWDYVPDAIIEDIFGDRWPGWVAEHAALTETSLMLYLQPELVNLNRMDHGHIPKAKQYKQFPQPPERLPASGMYAEAGGASAESGERIANKVADGILASAMEVFRKAG